MKRDKIGKEEASCPLTMCGIVISAQTESIKTSLELIGSFSKITGYEVKCTKINLISVNEQRKSVNRNLKHYHLQLLQRRLNA
jgi:hypothetical protein